MDVKMDVSIIVPVYGVEKVLHYCIESILHQTYTDLELILVDDGSPDNSGAVCDEYAKQDSRIKVIHKQNEGASAARNTGMDAARGKYIMFCDSDDYYESDYVETMLKWQMEYTDHNIWCCFNVVSNYNKKTGKVYNYDNTTPISFSDKQELMLLHEKWLLSSPDTKLYHRDILNQYNIRMRKEMSRGEDLIFNIEYLDKAFDDILIINNAKYVYVRTDNESLDTGYCKNMYEQCKASSDAMLKFLDKYCEGDEASYSKFHRYNFYKMYRVLSNTMLHPDMSFIKKMKYNNKLMRDFDYIDAFIKGKCEINLIYLKALKTKKYINIYILDQLVKLINKCRG